MRREDVIRSLEQAVGENISYANYHQKMADRAKAKGDHSSAGLAEFRAQDARWVAGAGMATINHLNGVSPD